MFLFLLCKHQSFRESNRNKCKGRLKVSQPTVQKYIMSISKTKYSIMRYRICLTIPQLTCIGVLDEHKEVKPTISLKYMVTLSKDSAVTGSPLIN